MPGAARLAAGRAGARTRAEEDISESRGVRVSRYPSLAVSSWYPSLAVSESCLVRESRGVRVSRHPSLAGSEPRGIRVDPARTAAAPPGRIQGVTCPAQHAAAGVIASATSWMPRCATRVRCLHLGFFQVSSFQSPLASVSFHGPAQSGCPFVLPGAPYPFVRPGCPFVVQNGARIVPDVQQPPKPGGDERRARQLF